VTTLTHPVAGTRVDRVPRPVLAAVLLAWVLAVLAETTGAAGAVRHDALLEDGPPLWVAVPLFVLAWQAMVAAMMVPSSLPLIRLYDRVSRGREGRWPALLAFLGGYAAVWTSFGVLALLGDGLLHRAVGGSPWLAQRPWLVAGGALALAGAFQFSALKEKCLTTCRHPAAYLMGRYRRGARAGFRLGFGHGLFCLGCCWALMLVLFAAGVAVLWWMAVLTAVMVYEKTGRHGASLSPVVGVALLALAVLVFANPPWLPGVLGS